MTSAAGVRYGVGMLRLSRFQQCAVRRLPSRKSSSILQFQTNVVPVRTRYSTVLYGLVASGVRSSARVLYSTVT